MRVFLAMLMSLVFLATSRADPVVIDTEGAPPGKYAFLVVVNADGSTTVKQIEQIIPIAANPTPVPTPVPTPAPAPVPPRPVSLKQFVEGLARRANDPETAEKLALGYLTVARQVAVGLITTKSQMAQVQQEIDNRMIADNKQVWEPLLAELRQHLNRMEQRGELNELADMVRAWRDISDGFSSVAKQAIGDRLTPDKRRELIKLIIQIILLIIGAG